MAFGADASAVDRKTDQYGTGDDKDGPRACDQAQNACDNKCAVDVSVVQLLSCSHRVSILCLCGKTVFFGALTLIVMDMVPPVVVGWGGYISSRITREFSERGAG